MNVTRTRSMFERKLAFLRALGQSADEGNQTMAASLAANAFEGAIRTAAGSLPEEPTPPDSPTGQDLDHFANALSPNLDINRNASAAAWSVSDALIRLDWLLLHLNDQRRFFFRGQENIEWPLESSAWRMMRNEGIGAPMPGEISQFESDLLADFQNRFLGGQTWASEEDRRRFSGIPLTSSSWWSLMQHYGGGTRLLDISSTFLEALYFACVDWDGSIDDTKYGVVHLFGEASGRIMYDEISQMVFDDRTPSTWDRMFNIDHVSTVRFYFPSGLIRNERIKAQRGAFLFWPQIELDFPGQSYFLRIHHDAKRSIAKELFRIGIQPRLLVHGPKGEKAYLTLCDELDLEQRDHD